MPTHRSTQPRSTRSLRTRKALAAAGIVIAGLSVGTGAAGAFPNGPGVIQNDPQPPPPPQPPLDKAPPPQPPKPPVPGPDQLAQPDPGVNPAPGPNGNNGGDGGGGSSNGGTSNGTVGAAAAGGTEIDATATEGLEQLDGAEASRFAVDGTPGKESDRPSDDDTAGTELAAGELTADTAPQGIAGFLTAVAAAVLAGTIALWAFLARRRSDDQDEVPAV